MGLFGPPTATKVVLKRDYEVERQRNLQATKTIIDFLFPDNRNIKSKNAIKRRLKNNPKMTAVVGSMLAAGVVLTVPIVVNLLRINTPIAIDEYKRAAGFANRSRRRRRRKSKTKKRKSKGRRK